MTTFYVFGESPNDTGALVHLIQARCLADKKASQAIALRAPLIHQKKANLQTSRSNSEKVAKAVMARLKVHKEKPVVVVAHEDCDQVEPAHTRIAARIETGLANVPVPVIAAAPAFEMEAWWYLWPEAVASVCKLWRPLGRKGTEIGLLENVKERLKSDLRPSGNVRVRDYDVTDAPAIARRIRELGIIDKRNAKSSSFTDFERKIRKHI